MRPSEALRAPAKLNLTLEVLSARPDGLHALRSVMVPVDICDEIRVEPAQRFRFTCNREDLVQDNLVLRALGLLGLASSPVHVRLHKRIPTGAGMGGGSSDAAAILLAAQRGLFGPPPRLDYLATARALGSDVPFFLTQTAALVEGTGERVTPLGAAPGWYALVIKPPGEVSTAWAYAQIDAAPRESRPRSSSVSVQLAKSLQRGDFAGVTATLHNDFQAVLAGGHPEITCALRALADAGAPAPLMTGSGSCVFALTQSAQALEALAVRIALPPGFQVMSGALLTGHAWRNTA